METPYFRCCLRLTYAVLISILHTKRDSHRPCDSVIQVEKLTFRQRNILDISQQIGVL